MNAIIRVSLYASVLALITGIATAPVYAEDNLNSEQYRYFTTKRPDDEKRG
ncbi:hypothetical protein [uncultured Tolumonas sp.]|uniref:hypothetical protein n=1 Tax=uncultured Tolumonas sp. TaxID=263765 RepID=UPI002A0A6F6A|nr:hypothetical protein [uncultured Tolumonas sp.]